MSEIEKNRSQTSIDPLASSIDAELRAELPGCQSRAPSNPIYKVPIFLREVDVKAYEPKILSIGPYHHGKENLQAMEKMKWQCLSHILTRNRNSTTENYVREIRVLESEARSSYSELNEINRMGSNNFVKMLLLDACFLLFVLEAIPAADSMEIPPSGETPQSVVIPNNEDAVQNVEILPREESQQNVHNEPAWSNGFLMHDILLLENQLPFFILRKIHELAVPNHSQSLTEITAAAVSDFLKYYIDVHPEIRSFNANHLLHFCYHFFCSDLGSDMDAQPSQRDIVIHQPVQLPRATELWMAGIKFKRAGNRKLLDIKFSNGTMEIPCLHVEDSTISLLRNLIALEQSCPTLGQHFISYAHFLVKLVSMPSDVELLSRKKIIEHHLGSDKDVSDRIRKLTLEISMLPGLNYLNPVCMEVNKTFAGSKFRRWVAWLRRKYNNPWLLLSLVAATTLLGCSILETVYTVEGYYN